MQALPFTNIWAAWEARDRRRKDKQQAHGTPRGAQTVWATASQMTDMVPQTFGAGVGWRNVDGKEGQAFRLRFWTDLDL